MGTDFQERLRKLGACDAAVEWVGGRTPEQAWAECPRGDWLLWVLERVGVDCSAVGYWCAERARQSALRALPPSPGRDRLAACAPIIDRATARAVAEAARAVAAVAQAAEEVVAAQASARAAWEAAAARAAEAAYAAEWAAAEAAGAAQASARAARAAEEAEALAIAEYVREGEI